MSVVCSQVDVSATGRSPVQRSPTECVVSLCVISKRQESGGSVTLWAVAPEEKTLKIKSLKLSNIKL